MKCYYLTACRAVAKCSSETAEVYFIYDAKDGWVRDEWAITLRYLRREDLKGKIQEIPEKEMKKRIGDKSYRFRVKSWLKAEGIPEESGTERAVEDLAKRSHSALPKGALRIALNACAADPVWGDYYFHAPSFAAREFIGLNCFYLLHREDAEYRDAVAAARAELERQLQPSDRRYIDSHAPGAGSDTPASLRSGQPDGKDPQASGAGAEDRSAQEERLLLRRDRAGARDPEDNQDEVLSGFYEAYGKKDYGRAKDILKRAIDAALPHFEDSEEIENHDFRNGMQVALYSWYFAPKKKVQFQSVPLSRYYSLYGSVLIDEKRLDEARGAFARALYRNPTDFDIFSEYVETFRNAEDIETFGRLSRLLIRYAVTSSMVARVQRNMGYYFAEKENYRAAIACLELSGIYKPENKMAENELAYIRAATGEEIPMLSEKEVRELAEKYDFPLGAYDDVVGLALHVGESRMKSGDREDAVYYYRTAYDLTDNPYVKKVLDALTGGGGKDSRKGDQS